MTIIDDYLKDQITYSKKYGDRTIVLMQVGHFYECYGVDNVEEQTNSKNLYRLTDILDIQLTRKNKNIKENSRKNPLMIGVNIYSIDKYIQILLNNNYTSVLIEQTSEAPFVDRKVTNIYSPGTNVQYNLKGETNNLMCIYIESPKALNYSKNIMCIGIATIDLSTGKNNVFEVYSKPDDTNLGLDEIFRIIQTYDPKELLIVKKNLTKSNEFLCNYLDLSRRVVHFKEDTDVKAEYYELNYQKTMLERIFPNTGLLSIIEYLDLENMPFGVLSYIQVLDFAYEHNATIVDKICKPNIVETLKQLTLTNNCINQLNLVEHSATQALNCKYNSLFSVLNNASTSIGKRLLRDRLLNPILDPTILNTRYDYIESMMMRTNVMDESKETKTNEESNKTINLYKIYENNLVKIQDIERLHRKLGLGLLQPADFASLDFSYEHINNILDIKNDSLSSLRPSTAVIAEFNSFITCYTTDFNIDEIVKYHLDKITTSFFKKGVVPEIDALQIKIDNYHYMFDTIIKKLSKFIDSGPKKSGQMQTLLKIDSNDRDGYYISLTTKRSNVLNQNLKKEKYPKLEIKFTNKVVEIDTQTLETKTATKPNVKITNGFLKDLSNKLVACEHELQELCRTQFLERLIYYDSKWCETLKIICDYIANVDLIKSIAKTSINYGYVRPKIVESSNSDDSDTQSTSFIKATALRHPIIERINTDTNYVPNDICLGTSNKLNDSVNECNSDTVNDTTGILLFGTNASGKSSLMKAVGVNIIMAQAGFFVAAKEFSYSPYEYLFTRINNNDNIFKGESSFAVEMGELRSILKRANSKSLVLGDELCSGTENISALSIFSSSVVNLDKRQTNFIFATHLHDLCKIPQVTELKTIKMLHLKVIFNEETGELIYDRKLETGNGPTIYGLEVCRAMDMDSEFLKLSEQIRKQILGQSQQLLEPKKSHYNATVFVHDCNVCQQKAEDVHHIKFQCTANDNNIIESHIVKDTKSNLVPLCKKCHNEVHNGSLEISGYVQTSDGIKLDYKYLTKEVVEVKKSKGKKLSEEQIEIINEFNELNKIKTIKIKQKEALIYLEKTHDIKISMATYSKIIKGKY
jgi:DNA mismatch repair protein MutS